MELTYINLIFYIDKKGLLRCKQLAIEVDPNQNGNILYRLSNILILHKRSNRMQRSIVTTMGDILYQHCGIPVSIRKKNTGAYARYDIDDVLIIL
jgi:hypothetical protein